MQGVFTNVPCRCKIHFWLCLPPSSCVSTPNPCMGTGLHCGDPAGNSRSRQSPMKTSLYRLTFQCQCLTSILAVISHTPFSLIVSLLVGIEFPCFLRELEAENCSHLRVTLDPSKEVAVGRVCPTALAAASIFSRGGSWACP
jgi:hypothetical protein